MFDAGLKLRGEVSAEMPMQLTLRERLENRRKAAAGHLADIEQAIEFLDKNPNFETFHNIIGKTGF